MVYRMERIEEEATTAAVPTPQATSLQRETASATTDASADSGQQTPEVATKDEVRKSSFDLVYSL